MNDLTASLLSWLLLPLALGQGIGLRRTATRMPPPRGPQSGRVGASEPLWRILVMGDSSAAGVGAERTADTLGPQIARIIHDRTGESVSWRNAGANSAISEEVRDHVLPHVDGRDFTHVVLVVGTNDMKNYNTKARFTRGFGGLLYACHARWPEAVVIWSPVINMPEVPIMPPRLARILALRTQIINAIGNELCSDRLAIASSPLPIEGRQGFAVDGFHANAVGYAYWAEHLANVILRDAGRSSPSAPQ